MASDDIQGTITDDTGTAISGATVALWLQSSPGQVVTTTTDASGNYIFENHPDADGTSKTWHLAARDPNDSTRQFRSLHSVSASLPSPSTIPDSGNLQALYDARDLSLSDGDPVSTWPDSSGNGNDLTAASAPTYRTGFISGNPVVKFDGVNDLLNVSFPSDVSQPVHIFALTAQQTQSSTNSAYHYDGDTANQMRFVGGGNPGDWNLYAGSVLGTGDDDEDSGLHLHSHLYDGSDSVARIDRQQIITGDAGSQSLDGITLGARADGDFSTEIEVAMLMVYEVDETTNISSIENYISTEYDIDPVQRWVENTSENPIISQTESWESGSIQAAHAVYNSTDSEYKVVYQGFGGSERAIGLATGPSLDDLTKYSGNPILTGSGAAGTFDENQVGEPDLYFDGTTYYLFYSGWSGGTGQGIGVATGTDLTTLSRSAENPLITTSASGWDSNRILGSATVQDSNGDWQMYFSGRDSSNPDKTGYATGSTLADISKVSATNPVFTPGPSGSDWEFKTIIGDLVLDESTGVHNVYLTGLMDNNAPSFVLRADTTDYTSYTNLHTVFDTSDFGPGPIRPSIVSDGTNTHLLYHEGEGGTDIYYATMA